ncbi:hypothetical protein K32_34700 [Kaistia sp. 32K]|nr:hypothetical protein K32_34700 [Kaistia sp. 32K]
MPRFCTCDPAAPAIPEPVRQARQAPGRSLPSDAAAMRAGVLKSKQYNTKPIVIIGLNFRL